MKTSQSGIEIIRSHEGLKLTSYKCPAGVWTIGYGHTKGVKPGDRITEQKAVEYLKEDLNESENTINAQNLVLNQNQFDAIASFIFNVGSANFKNSTLLKKAKANSNDPTIAGEFAKWNKARDPKTGKLVVLSGLVKRRNQESELYFKK